RRLRTPTVLPRLGLRLFDIHCPLGLSPSQDAKTSTASLVNFTWIVHRALTTAFPSRTTLAGRRAQKRNGVPVSSVPMAIGTITAPFRRGNRKGLTEDALCDRLRPLPRHSVRHQSIMQPRQL